MTVTWLGLTAVYTDTEREIIAALPVREQTFVHALKAMTDGEIGGSPALVEQEGSSVRETGLFQEGASCSPAPSVYTEPEDIEFGAPDQMLPKPKKKPRGDQTSRRSPRPIYALVWTWKAHKVCKTKARATRSMKAWKRWYERQGWKVVKLANGYLAVKAGERHEVIALHEYDAATHQRLA